MRLVRSDLRRLLHAQGCLDPALAVAICEQVASALDAAHSRGLVHRDVKPSNVLLDQDEHAYLADFGLTRRSADPASTRPGDCFVGTLAYLAPEQLGGSPADRHADVYALGCMLFECLTGTAPYLHTSRLEVAWAHLEEQPPRASSRRPALPRTLDQVIARAMDKNPEHRHETCSALVAAADSALRQRRWQQVLRRPAPRPPATEGGRTLSTARRLR
jgi:serine/threonine-protein kinase